MCVYWSYSQQQRGLCSLSHGLCTETALRYTPIICSFTKHPLRLTVRCKFPFTAEWEVFKLFLSMSFVCLWWANGPSDTVITLLFGNMWYITSADYITHYLQYVCSLHLICDLIFFLCLIWIITSALLLSLKGAIHSYLFWYSDIESCLYVDNDKMNFLFVHVMQLLEKHKTMDSMVELLELYEEEDQAYGGLLEASTQLYQYLLQPFRDMRELAMLRRQQIKVTVCASKSLQSSAYACVWMHSEATPQPIILHILGGIYLMKTRLLQSLNPNPLTQ